MKASNVIAPKRTAKEKPDLEEAIEESDEGEVIDDPKDEEDEDVDLSKDKYVKQPKKKAAPKKAAAAGGAAAGKKAAGKGKKKTKDEEMDDFIDDEEDVKPKKGKGRAKK